MVGNNYISRSGLKEEARLKSAAACAPVSSERAACCATDFSVDRRAARVNAGFRKAPADQPEERLDILGRLLACTSQPEPCT